MDWFDERYVGGKIHAEAATNMDEARRLIDEGRGEEARPLLEPILERVEDPTLAPDALLLQARLEAQAGNNTAAIDILAQGLERYPGVPERPNMALEYASLLEGQERYAEAVAVYQDLRETAPGEHRARAITGLGRDQERNGQPAIARDLYALALADSEWGSDTWFEAAKPLSDLNVQAILSSQPTEQSKVYRVESGDTLTSIGMKLNTTQGLLIQANRIERPEALYIGQNLKYTPKDFHVVIERSTCRLYLMDSDGLFKVYSVGLGKPGNDTSLGRYRIGNKEKDPTWHKPGFGPIPPGDPRNELGTRWMPLIPEAEGLPTDLGIHGTIAPETVGQYTSMGCPRLLPGEIEELYDLIVRSTPVTIVQNYDPAMSL